jgi:flagellar biosynthesis protein FliR
MEKYFKQIIAIELLCLAYGFIHNFLYMSQYVMIVAASLAMTSSILLFWICLKSKVLNKKQKTIGLLVAGIPLLIIVGSLIFVFIMATNMH